MLDIATKVSHKLNSNGIPNGSRNFLYCTSAGNLVLLNRHTCSYHPTTKQAISEPRCLSISKCCLLYFDLLRLQYLCYSISPSKLLSHTHPLAWSLLSMSN